MSSADGYYFVGFIQAHGLVPDPGRPQLRKEAPNYGGLKMKVLSVPGKHYISGQMGPMYELPEQDEDPWYGKSTDVVFPGILREEFFNCDVDGAFDKNKAFESARQRLKKVYEEYAKIKFPEGGFTIEENPSDQRVYQLHRNPGEQLRDEDGKQKGRAVAGDFQPVPENGYGVFCICTNHPELQNLSLCSVDEREIQDLIIPSKLYPRRNMIGKTDEDPPGKLGAAYWKRAVDSTSSVTEEIKEHANKIIENAWSDRTIHIQDLIDVLNALNIKQAWLFDPACRDLDEDAEARLSGEAVGPREKDYPDSLITEFSQSPSPPPSPSQSPPPPQPSYVNLRSKGLKQTEQNDHQWVRDDLNIPVDTNKRGKGRLRPRSVDSLRDNRTDGGGSRKSRKQRSTRLRNKNTRKTKRRVHKRKSRKRNTRK